MELPAGQLPFHLSCPFTGRAVCRCLCGTGATLQDESAAAAAAYMRHARAAWRRMHDADGDASADPVVLWLPKLVRREGRAPGGPQGGVRGPPTKQAAEAAVQQAEAAARVAALRAAGLASAAGLHYRPPESLAAGGLDLSSELAGFVQADHSELERQAAAVRAAQEARQAAAASAAARGAMGGVEGASLGASLHALAAGGGTPDARLLAPGGPALSGGRRTRSQEQGALDNASLRSLPSLPLPASSAGSGGRAARRSAQGRPPAKPPTASRAGRAGPGKAPRGKGAAAKQPRGAALVAAQAGAGGAAATTPSLAPFGPGYQPRGPSSATPPSHWLLSMHDFKPSLQGRLVQTFWADGGCWWPAVVLRLSAADRRCSLFYETGDEEVVEFAQLAQAGEVAWLQEPPAAARPSGSLDGGRRQRGLASQPGGPPLGRSISWRSDRSHSDGPGGGGGGDMSSVAPGASSPLVLDSPLLGGLMGSGSGSLLHAAARGDGGGLAGPGDMAGAGPGPLGWDSDSGEGLGMLPGSQPPLAALLAGASPAGSEGSGQLLPDLLPLGAGRLCGGEELLLDASPRSPPRQQHAADGRGPGAPRAAGPGEQPAQLQQAPEAGKPQGVPSQQDAGAQTAQPADQRARQQEQQVEQAAPAAPTEQHPGAAAPVEQAALQGVAQGEQPVQRAPDEPSQQTSVLAGGAPAPAPPQAPGPAPSPEELPPPLAAGVAQLPPGVLPSRAAEVLALGEGATGRAVLVCTLTSDGWQPARVRRCSPAEGVLHVLFEDGAAVALQAQQEGRTFLLCASL